MKNFQLPLLVAVCLISWNLMANAEDEQNAAKVKLPAESEKWTIAFEGSGGTPGDRSRFHLLVSHDGAVEVRKGRKSLGNPIKGKLTEEETHKLYDHVCKSMKAYDKTKSKGRVMDGWGLTLNLKGDSSDVLVEYSEFSNIEDASSEFKEIQRIINKKFPQVDFPE